MTTALNKKLEIGTPVAGGFFAGMISISGNTYGIVVAPKFEGESDGIWLSSYDDVPGATSCHDGLTNTQAMAAAGSPIAKWALGLAIDGHNDWYIPSRDELEIIYRNLKPSGHSNSCSFRDGDNPSSVPVGYPYTKQVPSQTSISGFQEGGAQALDATWHWSSTQYSPVSAWIQYFDDGGQNVSLKGTTHRARAVRRLIIQ